MENAGAAACPAGRRVVVTGLGLVTCLGSRVEAVWKRLLAGECGITALEDAEYSKIPCKVAGRVPRGDNPGGLCLERHIPAPELRTISTASAYALVAAERALTDAEWKPGADEEARRFRTGVAVGAGMVDLEEIVRSGTMLRDEGYRTVSPYFLPKILINMTAGYISLKYGFQGPNHSVTTACATGLHAIGDASRFIACGDADVMVAGGTEACINPLAVAGFSKIRALSTGFNSRPQRASRPFDRARDGFVMADGAGVVVLEELDHARARGAGIYAEILGYGLAGEAHHITAPRADGLGSSLAMKYALSRAGLQPSSVRYLNAHATSTPLGDAAEIRAVRRLFGRHSSGGLCISSTKGATGHLLGAAGSVEAIFTILAVHTGLIPPTINLNEVDDDLRGLNLVPNESQEWPAESSRRRFALTNSFGFGGTLASVCVGNLKQDD